ncbi:MULTISPECIES: deoxyribose-phosphate aldolase [Brochothrix]|uniref:Deoxyribose-phosphate aldolase n=1 Tax=Brochothrix thermosphacta TaxID=2756 RepID=A0A1D2KKX9_BROTH|nr:MULTISPECIES: deoxyribose-phosphate aldolase [Brochothrix]ATF26453.1 deoxyribose-phosphate aldolase [Brochothrix thermosphacta]ATH85805.1 deoxyribose-phosphate aldolase [Brochothrix thermosphacta]EUJ37548.1 deoxyribose-phosphate aldolase [Brochothrix thermosphacta DSM 20171 = FSL F6-1036]MBR5526581.1 deoxyribose-phosphate aldolase [Brochothrix sp.]ODJ48523.1 deoxyribose-phosphate aldolase [Brochothrix thermosphacta DSM 20171 = FSL F6-1036]
MSVAKMIDHTLLKPDATQEEIEQLIKEAKQYDFASVCINASWVQLAAQQLKETEIDVCTVVGFPLGATTTAVKKYEAEEALENGANEIDMVMNIGALKSGNDELVQAEIETIAILVHRYNGLLKVILETSLLSDEQIERACQLAVAAGTDYVKTSTGFNGDGATVEAVSLMRRTVGEKVGVKASGGIRTKDDLQRMIVAGANRVGASSSIELIR